MENLSPVLEELRTLETDGWQSAASASGPLGPGAASELLLFSVPNRHSTQVRSPEINRSDVGLLVCAGVGCKSAPSSSTVWVKDTIQAPEKESRGVSHVSILLSLKLYLLHINMQLWSGINHRSFLLNSSVCPLHSS